MDKRQGKGDPVFYFATFCQGGLDHALTEDDIARLAGLVNIDG